MSNNQRNCTQIDCRFKFDGICAKGFEVEKCPTNTIIDLINEEEEEEEEEEDEDENELNDTNDYNIIKKDLQDDSTSITLFSESLSFKDLPKITNKHQSKYICVIGESDSGKTTLLATILDLFQLGCVGQYAFSNSITLKGFELRSHLSRKSSNLEIPDTMRTKIDDLTFLHLGINKLPNLESQANHLLLLDVSGEKMRDAASTKEVMTDLEILKYCSNITFIVDGEKLSKIKEANLVIYNSHQFFQQAIECEIMNERQKIQLVISKWDKVGTSEDLVFSNIDRIKSRFRDRIEFLEPIKIAARPLANVMHIELGFGIKFLLDSWIHSEKLENSQIDNNYAHERFISNYHVK